MPETIIRRSRQFTDYTCKNYTDIKFISRTGTFLQVKTETSVYCTITGAHHTEGS